jgi:type I restriction enzyme, S subunit
VPLTEKKNAVGRNSSDFTLLSLTLQGVIPRNMDNPQGKFPAEFNSYKIVEPNNLIFCLFDVEETPRTVGHANQRGMITGAYDVFECGYEIDSRYLYYYYLSLDFDKRLQPLYSGLRKVIKIDTFLAVKSPVPPLKEQKRIVEFLDRKTSEIDQAIAQKQHLIQLLQEQKNILINQAITKGLNPNVPMKNSETTWLGEVPAHWEVCSVKRLTQILRGKFSHRPRNDPRFYDGHYPFIQTGDISRSGRTITEYSQTLNKKGYTISKEFPVGTVVMVITGAKTGEVSILGFNACFPDSAVGFVPQKGRISSDFLYYMFSVLKTGLDSVVIVSTQENLNVERIGALYTVCPPLNEQMSIVEFLDNQMNNFEHAQERIERQIRKLQEYHQLFIANAVTGKIKI